MPDAQKGPLVADLLLARRLESTDAWVSLLSAQIHAQLHPESGALAEPMGGGYAVFTGVGSPLTQATGLGMKGPVTGPELDRLEAFFEVRGSPTIIDLCPLADPSIIEELGIRGYRIRDFSNMLVRQLREGGERPPVDEGLRVQQCTAAEDTLWAGTVAQGFADNLIVSEENMLVLKSLFHRPDSICYLAWLEGRPVGGGALAMHEGVAALYGASTLHSFRRRGVQKAVILALLARAVDGGCDVAYTLTKPGSVSQRNVERQHFSVAYTRAMMVRQVKE